MEIKDKLKREILYNNLHIEYLNNDVKAINKFINSLNKDISILEVYICEEDMRINEFSNIINKTLRYVEFPYDNNELGIISLLKVYIGSNLMFKQIKNEKSDIKKDLLYIKFISSVIEDLKEALIEISK